MIKNSLSIDSKIKVKLEGIWIFIYGLCLVILLVFNLFDFFFFRVFRYL